MHLVRLFLYVCVCVCVSVCVCARARMRVRVQPPRSTCECGCYKCAGGRLRLLHLWKVCVCACVTACIREERQRPALLLLADDAYLGFCLSLSGLPWSLLRVRLLQMCRRPSADATSVPFPRAENFSRHCEGVGCDTQTPDTGIQLLMEITQPPRTAFT